MAKKKPRFLVVIWESERGWGQKPFHAIGFQDYDKAVAKVNSVNAENNLSYVPDWYHFAVLETDPGNFDKYKHLM